MKATISIPQHWAYPRFALDQRTEQGNSQFAVRNSQLSLRELQEINYPISRPSKRLPLPCSPLPALKAMGYFFTWKSLTANCELRIANCFGWRYALMPNKNSDEISYLKEDQIQPLTPEELFSEITAEIKFYQQQISILQQQLVVLTGGFTNA
ncbi:hypothetical protein [Nostoc sp. LEGE 12447]|uniref:hypothetical protein n=1 Tax=Nostoc sp. LEGE 12447 TaxID=1828640 RepID=UPI001D134C98|nr:hypothetical protein [Nostoc sp. LEGE 12447]